MLAFLVVILVAVGTVALLTGRVTDRAFRQYALTRSGVWEGLTTQLADYYVEQGSWQGIQDVLAGFRDRWPRGRDRDGALPGPPPRMVEFRIADAEGQVVGDTLGVPRGTLSRHDLKNAVPIEAEDMVVGYLLPAFRNPPDWPLDAAQATFIATVRRILWIGTGAALTMALIVGGLLFRSITAPLRELTVASEAIAQGDLSARAEVRGRDEVAQLADSFNEMAESLMQMETARRNQTADIAHELRTPLTVLQGTLEAMLDGVYPSDSDNLQAALSQTRTLARLIEDLRVLALADAGKLRLEEQALDLGAFLSEVVEAYQPQAIEQGITLVLEAVPSLPAVAVDRDRLAQVMGNLLSNSLRYLASGGHINVAARGGTTEVVVSVIDDGPGVPSAELDRLFERFWRADPARQRATGGSGLGLSIARHIVEAHGGRIWGEPTPGGGLTVRFSLPVN
jgi:signal transduction histidine kinase